MAILGFQLVTTLIGASVLSKIVTCYSFTRFIYNGLVRFLTPSDQRLMDASGNFKLKSKGKKRRPDPTNALNNNSDADLFYFPRAVPISLQTARITFNDASKLPLYSSCQWLIDFTLCSVAIYAVTEVVQNCPPGAWLRTFLPASAPTSKSKVSLSNMISLNTRFNLSLLWLGLTLYFTLRTLVSMTAIYFRSEGKPDMPPSNAVARAGSQSSSNPATSEWFLVLAAAFIFLLIAGFSLALDGRYFDFGLQAAYHNLTLNTTEIHVNPLLSWGAFHAILAVMCAFIGALFVYPGMKFGRIYLDCVRLNILTSSVDSDAPLKSCIQSSKKKEWLAPVASSSQRPLSLGRRILLHSAFLCPLIPILLWVKPVTDQLVRSVVALRFSPGLAQQHPSLLLVVTLVAEWLSVHLASLRLLTALWVVILRLITARSGIQAYLDSAQERVNQFSREPGRTSNREVQRLVSSIFYCLNLVVLQWLAPTILLLTTICLYKTCANLQWFPIATSPLTTTPAPLEDVSQSGASTMGDDFSASWPGMLVEMRFAFHQFTSLLGAQGSAVSRGVLGFLTWWCLLSLQLVSLLGVAYHSFASN